MGSVQHSLLNKMQIFNEENNCELKLTKFWRLSIVSNPNEDKHRHHNIIRLLTLLYWYQYHWSNIHGLLSKHTQCYEKTHRQLTVSYWYQYRWQQHYYPNTLSAIQHYMQCIIYIHFGFCMYVMKYVQTSIYRKV